MAAEFLHGPDGLAAEVARRQGANAETEASLRRELADLDMQERLERDAEARAFRLAATAIVSEEVYAREAALMRTKLMWVKEQRQRLESQRSDLARLAFDPRAAETLRQRLDARLEGATPADRRFVLEAIGAKVVARPDRSWDLELSVPAVGPASVESPCQFENALPRSG